jgi:hypothetical protein
MVITVSILETCHWNIFHPHPSHYRSSHPTLASQGWGSREQYIYRDRAVPNQFILCLQDKEFEMYQILPFLSAANLVLPDCSTLPVELWAIILR